MSFDMDVNTIFAVSKLRDFSPFFNLPVSHILKYGAKCIPSKW